jgi:CBS domain-containing protein
MTSQGGRRANDRPRITNNPVADLDPQVAAGFSPEISSKKTSSHDEWNIVDLLSSPVSSRLSCRDAGIGYALTRTRRQHLMKVKEIMTAKPAVCGPDTPLQEVARTMVGRDCGSVPVVGAADGRVAGIITDRDIVVRGVAEGRNPLTLTASACMTSPVVTIDENASLDDCTDLMESKKIRRLPVLSSSGALVGIVAQADVARCASRKDAGELVRDVSAPSR